MTAAVLSKQLIKLCQVHWPAAPEECSRARCIFCQTGAAMTADEWPIKPCQEHCPAECTQLAEELTYASARGYIAADCFNSSATLRDNSYQHQHQMCASPHLHPDWVVYCHS